MWCVLVICNLSSACFSSNPTRVACQYSSVLLVEVQGVFW
jgi:hypothetical protein